MFFLRLLVLLLLLSTLSITEHIKHMSWMEDFWINVAKGNKVQ